MIDPQVNLAIAFGAGFLIFFAPCILPLIPLYLGYMAGLSAVEDARVKSFFRRRARLFLNSLIFVLGFSLVFVLMGLAAGSIGTFLNVHRVLVQRIGGGLMILLGLYFLEIFKIPWLYRSFKFQPQKYFTRFQYLNSFLIGLTFAFAWTPCIGPVLAVILFWASQVGSLVESGLLLFAYALGIGVPFLIVALLIDFVMPWLKKFAHFLRVIQILGGVAIILAGLLLLFNRLDLVTISLISIPGISEIFKYR